MVCLVVSSCVVFGAAVFTLYIFCGLTRLSQNTLTQAVLCEPVANLSIVLLC